MIGLRRTASMASGLAIQASCQAAEFQKCHTLQIVEKATASAADRTPHRKFAIRPTLVRRTIVGQTIANRVATLWLHAIYAIAQIHSVLLRACRVKQRRAPNPA
jgi:hypothetical protein